jgi:hypothetical protein
MHSLKVLQLSVSTSAYSRYYVARNITEHLVKENKYNRAATQKALVKDLSSWGSQWNNIVCVSRVYKNNDQDIMYMSLPLTNWYY